MVNTLNRHGDPSLHLAVHLRHKEMVRLLLDSGADIISKNGGGWSALQEVHRVIALLINTQTQTYAHDAQRTHDERLLSVMHTLFPIQTPPATVYNAHRA